MRLNGVYTLALAGVLLGMVGGTGDASETAPLPFMAISGTTSEPVGFYEFCLDHASECAVKSDRDSRVHLTPERWNELVAVNNDVDTKITPVTDMAQFGRPDVWSYPTDKGDCEDYVLLKRRDLIEKGWPVGALLITVVRQTNGDGHAVLTVLTDRGDLILDNLDPHVLSWSKTPYRFVKRQSEYNSGQWVAIGDGRAPLVGSLH